MKKRKLKYSNEDCWRWLWHADWHKGSRLNIAAQFPFVSSSPWRSPVLKTFVPTTNEALQLLFTVSLNFYKERCAFLSNLFNPEIPCTQLSSKPANIVTQWLLVRNLCAVNIWCYLHLPNTTLSDLWCNPNRQRSCALTTLRLLEKFCV